MKVRDLSVPGRVRMTLRLHARGDGRGGGGVGREGQRRSPLRRKQQRYARAGARKRSITFFCAYVCTRVRPHRM